MLLLSCLWSKMRLGVGVVVVWGAWRMQAVLKLEPDDRDEQYAGGHLCRL